MKILINVFVLLFLLSGLSGCKSTKEFPKEQLSTDRWLLKYINTQDADSVFSATIPVLHFSPDSNQVSVNSGCNIYSGIFSFNKRTLTISELISTDKMCASNNSESLFLELLSNPSELSIAGNELIFSYRGKKTLVFSRTKSITRENLRGMWRLKSMESKNVSDFFKENIPTLDFNFSTEKITGNAGCNNYKSSFSLINSTLNIGPFITSRKTCGDIEGESIFINLLPGIIDAEFSENMLVLKKEGKIIMTFNR